MENRENRIEGVIFDMDGLLLDTESIVKRTWTDVGTAMGYPDMGEQIYHTLGFSRPRRKAYFQSVYGPDWPDEEIVSRCGIRFNEIVDAEGIPVKKGARELLEYLKAEGIRIGLATSTSEEYARQELEQAGLWDYFDGRVFGSMITRSKPAPEIYEKACAAIGVEPKHALALEDAPSGVQSAHDAGLRVIMIPDLVQPTEEVRRMTWDVKAALEEVIEIIKAYHEDMNSVMKLTSDKSVYSFSKTHEPALRVEAPVQLTLETLDCYGNQLRDGKGSKAHINWDNVNPATGPVFVEGAMPGDALKVTIDKINVADFGVACNGDAIRLIPVAGDAADFLGQFQIPLNKMIGVIGVAPAGEPVNNGTPGKHGGNMDTKFIGEGTVLYLPVAVEGALFGVGDVHAVMGDGEVGGTGLEIPAEVTVTLEVIKGGAPAFPLVETDDVYAFIVSDKTIDAATDTAVALMHGFLKSKMSDLSDEEIYILMSLAGSTEISQIVDPLKTARFVFPKKYVK